MNMNTAYHCGNENRRDVVRLAKGGDGNPILNGIDYLEVVSFDQKTLAVHFIHPLPGQPGAVPPAPAAALTAGNFVITGGVRVRTVRVLGVVTLGNVVTLTTDAAGDYSTYTLRLVAGESSALPPGGFDPQLAALAFTFKVECPSGFDCAPRDDCPPPNLPAPTIDYLSKDYASFRRLMLDRMSATLPGWQERNPADLGVALVEAVAYSADHLSHYQDAVATESYLGTARQRASLRRHARLLDYAMHDGCNARVWVCFQVTAATPADGTVLTHGSILLTRGLGADPVVHPAVLAELLRTESPVIFETLHDLTLRSAHNEIRFYTWDNTECCLPCGATRATLHADLPPALGVGDVLIFEEVISPETGLPADADPTHRHAVRLTHAEGTTDPLHGLPLVEIAWDAADALPFPLCISAVIRGGAADLLMNDLSVARGNVALADHGLTIPGEALGHILPGLDGNLPRPMLAQSNITRQGHARDCLGELVRDANNQPVVFDPAAPASGAMQWAMGDTLPSIILIENGNTGNPWLPRFDLLASSRFDPHFAIETNNAGQAFIRFGDGFHGQKPKPDSTFSAVYRVGNGPSGNVGAGAIARVVTALPGLAGVRNPLAARGGTEAESLELVRQYAPQAFRIQQRAITPADYAAMAARHPQVQKAAATLRWTGSWHTVFITIDRKGGRPVDAEFEAELRAFMKKFRLAGQDIEIDGPRFVALDIVFTVCVLPGYFRSQVREDLLRRFGTRELPDGSRGFFHPDNFTFGQPLFLSQVIALAMEVPGVKWVDAEDAPAKPNRFRRWGQPAAGEFAAGKIAFGRLEIARLDNDPSLPENGRIDFVMEGGL